MTDDELARISDDDLGEMFSTVTWEITQRTGMTAREWFEYAITVIEDVERAHSEKTILQ